MLTENRREIVVADPDLLALPFPPAAVGPGAIARLPELVRALATGPVPHCGLVTGPGFADRSWSRRVRSVLEPLDCQILTSGRQVSPEEVGALSREMLDGGVDVVIAVGGGAVIDAAKAAAALVGTLPAAVRSGDDGDGEPKKTGTRVEERVDADAVRAACREGRLPAGATPAVIAVPTTPGTGAEVTPFASVWDRREGRKLSLTGGRVAPAAAVLDPDLLHGLDRAQLVASALDTLAQGAEAAWSVRSTPEATRLGLGAVALASRALTALLERGSGAEPVVLSWLQLAGHLSGHAISIAQTSSCHALSYALTLRLGLPHGHACGTVLGRMLAYNGAVGEADCTDPRGTAAVRDTLHRIGLALGAATPVEGAARVESWLGAAGLARYDDLAADHAGIAADALSYPRCRDNPRRLEPPALAELLAAPPPEPAVPSTAAEGSEAPCR